MGSDSELCRLNCEILENLFFDFLDGKSLFFLFLAVSGASPGKIRLQNLTAKVMACRLQLFWGLLEATISAPLINQADSNIRVADSDILNAGRTFLREILEWTKECFPAHLGELSLLKDRPPATRQIMALAVVTEFFKTNPIVSVYLHSCPTKLDIGRYRLEWPLWRGPIEVSIWMPQDEHYYAEQTQVFFRAEVEVFPWEWNPSDLIAWHGLHNVVKRRGHLPQCIVSDSKNSQRNGVMDYGDYASFVTEPVCNNFLPSQSCTGRMVGAQSKDCKVLQQISHYLQKQSYVAVLRSSETGLARHGDSRGEKTIRSVRFIGRAQAQIRFEHHRNNNDDNNGVRCFHRWADSSDAADLICCWDSHGDGNRPSADRCVPALTSLLQSSCA